MALAEQAKLVVTLGLQDKTKAGVKSIRGGLGSLDKATGRTQKSFGKMSANLGTGLKIGAGLAVGGLALLVGSIKGGVDSLMELEDVQAQTAAVLASTGERANVGAKQVRELANEFEDLTTIDDKVIQGAENVLLGLKGIDDMNFKPVLAASLDLGVALHKGPEEAAKMVGRAMQDPVKGIALLTRAGVKFTDKEKKKITQLVKTGKAFDAQDIILGKLTTQFGGRAAAAADTYRGTQARLADAFEEAKMALATGFIPVLSRLSRKLAGVLKDPAVIERIAGFGEKLAGLFNDKNIDGGTSKLKDLWGYLSTQVDWAAIKGGLQTTFDVGKKAFELFNNLDPEMKKILIGALAVNKLTGGLASSVITDLAGIALKSLSSIFAGNVTVIGKSVITPDGGGLPVGAGAAGAGAAGVGSLAIPILVAGAGGLMGAEFILSMESPELAEVFRKHGGVFGIAAEAAMHFPEQIDVYFKPKPGAAPGGVDALGNPTGSNTGSSADADYLPPIAANTQATTDAVNAKLAEANVHLAESKALTAQLVPPAGRLPDQIYQLKTSQEVGLGSLRTTMESGNVSAATGLGTVRAAMEGVGSRVTSSGDNVAGAVRAKNMSVTVNVRTDVSIRDYARTISTRNRFGSVRV